MRRSTQSCTLSRAKWQQLQTWVAAVAQRQRERRHHPRSPRRSSPRAVPPSLPPLDLPHLRPLLRIPFPGTRQSTLPERCQQTTCRQALPKWHRQRCGFSLPLMVTSPSPPSRCRPRCLHRLLPPIQREPRQPRRSCSSAFQAASPIGWRWRQLRRQSVRQLKSAKLLPPAPPRSGSSGCLPVPRRSTGSGSYAATSRRGLPRGCWPARGWTR